MSKVVSRVWTFTSDSNPNKSYETLQYDDNSTSCNCPGWTRRVSADGSRTCKHTRLVDQGLADSHCVSSHEYAETKKAKAQPVTTPVKTAKTKMAKQPARKILWQ